MPKSLKMVLFFVGATLCRGGRTICGILRELGMQGEQAFSSYHQLLNRSKWQGLQAAKILFKLLLPFTEGKVILVVDEHLERRNREKIRAKGLYRDAVSSSKSWILGSKVGCALVTFPWSKRPFALPFFCVLRKPADYAPKRKHRSGIDLLCQMLKVLRRWYPELSLEIVGDGDYGRVKLVDTCLCLSIPLTSRLRKDARLHDFPDRQKYRGRPVKLGQRILHIQKKPWQEGKIKGYGGKKQSVKWTAKKCLWYAGKPETVLPVLAVWVRRRKNDELLLFSIDLTADPLQIIELYVLRWNLEVTFRECREHLGIQTQRQWSDLAIERTTPLLFCLYTLMILIGHTLYKQNKIKPEQAAWYRKRFLTFSDLLLAVRKELWCSGFIPNSSLYREFDKKNFCDSSSLLEKLAAGL